MVKQRREGLPLLPSASLIQSRQHLGSMQEWGPESPSYHSGFRISDEGQALLPMPKAVLIPTVTHHHVLKILPLIHPAGPVGATFAGAWRGGKGFGQGTRCWRCRPDLLGPVPAVEIQASSHLPSAAQCPAPGARPFLLLCGSQGELSSANEHAALTAMTKACSSVSQHVAVFTIERASLLFLAVACRCISECALSHKISHAKNIRRFGFDGHWPTAQLQVCNTPTISVTCHNCQLDGL